MIKSVILVLLIGMVPFVHADTDIRVNYYDQIAFKQHEFMIQLQSCDDTESLCYHKNRIQYAPIQVDMYRISQDDNSLTYIETIVDNTGKSGMRSIPIFMDHRYDINNQYAAIITSGNAADFDVVNFWLHHRAGH